MFTLIWYSQSSCFQSLLAKCSSIHNPTPFLTKFLKLQKSISNRSLKSLSHQLQFQILLTYLQLFLNLSNQVDVPHSPLASSCNKRPHYIIDFTDLENYRLLIYYLRKSTRLDFPQFSHVLQLFSSCVPIYPYQFSVLKPQTSCSNLEFPVLYWFSLPIVFLSSFLNSWNFNDSLKFSQGLQHCPWKPRNFLLNLIKTHGILPGFLTRDSSYSHSRNSN